ncbi:hypothetical protein NA56DRAFT_699034 [Hyaloscypha hepaticicola]|uniref:Uncharacterized protein n=1 Tax=Hyaloscypha hepaticicola TaxID=2082293 RepID=A0A2J6QI64_9HELO|nr:hypothetical protein NA56DRAFT_699034 [Hyaloscypha hepaticicola]
MNENRLTSASESGLHENQCCAAAFIAICTESKPGPPTLSGHNRAKAPPKRKHYHCHHGPPRPPSNTLYFTHPSALYSIRVTRQVPSRAIFTSFHLLRHDSSSFLPHQSKVDQTQSYPVVEFGETVCGE